jgi:RimJ/RimL family protein N-acetyltransferase
LSSLTFERSTDVELVRSLVTHPAVYRPGILADYAPAPGAWRAAENRGLWYVVARDDGAPLALYVFEWHSPVWCSVHLCFLPHAWGRALDVSRAALGWLAQSSGCRKLTAAVPAYNRLTHALARRVGMETVGVLSASIPHGGRLHDQTIYAISI